MRFWLGLILLLISARILAAEPLVLHTRIETDSGVKWGGDGNSGICPDILNALSKRLVDAKIVWGEVSEALPQRRLLAEVQMGHLDLACAFGKSDEKSKAFYIPETSIYMNHLVAVVRSNDTLSLAQLNDLRKLEDADVVLLNFGARLVDRLHQIGVKHVDQGAERPDENFKKLVLGRGRVYLYHEPGMSWELARSGLTTKLKVLPTHLSADQHYLLVSHAVPDAVRLQMEHALDTLKHDGSLAQIEAKWSGAGMVASISKSK